MKIGIIHTSYTQKGGEDSVVEYECRLLLENGYQVTYFNFKNPSNKLLQFLYFVISIFNVGSYQSINKWIKKEKPDIIHIHNWHFKASPSIIYSGFKFKIPILITLHNYRLLCPSATLFFDGHIFTESLRGGFPWAAIKNKLYRDSFFQTFWLACIIRFHHFLGTWQKVNKYIVLTPFAKQLFISSDLRLLPANIVVKGNSVRDNGFEITQRESKFLFVGRLTQEKGIEVLLDAFAASEYIIEIVGEGPLQSLVEKMSLKHINIKYIGIQSNTKIIQKMKKCTALVFPSVWFEGMPMTIIEAFSCGTPVISSSLGAMKDMVIDNYNGLFFNPGDANDLKSKILLWVRKTEAEREIYCTNARNSYDQNYNSNVNLERLASLYNSVQ